MKGKITTDHRDALLRLARIANSEAAHAAKEKALAVLIKGLKPVVNKAWPLKDMKVLARYGYASVEGRIKLRMGEGCACSEVSVPGEALGRLCPTYDTWNRKGRVLDLSDHPEVAALALDYQQACEDAKAGDKKLQVSLVRLVERIVRPNTNANRLAKIKELWPSPDVARICDQAMAGAAVVTDADLEKTIASAFPQKGNKAA